VDVKTWLTQVGVCAQEPVVEPAGVGVERRAGRRRQRRGAGAGAALARPLRPAAAARARAARPPPSALPVSTLTFTLPFIESHTWDVAILYKEFSITYLPMISTLTFFCVSLQYYSTLILTLTFTESYTWNVAILHKEFSIPNYLPMMIPILTFCMILQYYSIPHFNVSKFHLGQNSAYKVDSLTTP
jgi:hypothetical protein